MDKQLSPFPLPVGTNALMERLEALAREHRLGGEKYGFDGEAWVAKRAVMPEHVEYAAHIQREGEGEGVEMHFMHEGERGWTFHGLRIPVSGGEEPAHTQDRRLSGFNTDTPSSGLGMIWSDDPSELSVPLSSAQSPPADPASSSFKSQPFDLTHTPPLDSHSPFQPTPAEEEEEDEDSHAAETKRQAAASAFWAAWSPDAAGKNVDLPTPSEQREEDYWAQYSAGPSRVASTAQSPALPVRRLSERPGSGGAAGEGIYAGMLHGHEETEEGRVDAAEGRVFDAAGGGGLAAYTSEPISSEPTSIVPPSSVSAIPTDPTLSFDNGPNHSASHPAKSPPSNQASSALPISQSPPDHAPRQANDDALILRTRLSTKITSLLRRAWVGYTANVDRQDELEVRGMRWLELGREAAHLSGASGAGAGAGAHGWYTQTSGVGDQQEEGIKARIETMYELFDVAYDDDDDIEVGDTSGGIIGAGAGAEGTTGGTEKGDREARVGAAFYRVVEQAVRPAPGSGPSGEEGEGGLSVPAGGEVLGRRYSTEQLSYWES